jgi:hypothetical protein
VAQPAGTVHIRRHLVRCRVAEGTSVSAVLASFDWALTAPLADRLAAAISALLLL